MEKKRKKKKPQAMNRRFVELSPRLLVCEEKATSSTFRSPGFVRSQPSPTAYILFAGIYVTSSTFRSSGIVRSQPSPTAYIPFAGICVTSSTFRSSGIVRSQPSPIAYIRFAAQRSMDRMSILQPYLCLRKRVTAQSVHKDTVCTVRPSWLSVVSLQFGRLLGFDDNLVVLIEFRRLIPT